MKLDMYKHLAAGVNGVPYEEVDEEQREAIKIDLFRAGARGSLTNFAKMAFNMRCTVTSQGPVGELLLTGSYRAVLSAVVQLGHKHEDPVVEA